MKATRHSLHQPNNRLVCFEGVETPEELKKKACILLMKILMPGFYRENCWLSAVLARLFHTSVRGCLVGDLVLLLMYCLAGCVGVKHSQFDECTVVMAWSGKLVQFYFVVRDFISQRVMDEVQKTQMSAKRSWKGSGSIRLYLLFGTLLYNRLIPVSNGTDARWGMWAGIGQCPG